MITQRSSETTVTPREAVWRRGPVTLWRYGGEGGRAGKPVLLLPSIINRAYVLDLRPGQSLVEWLRRDAGRDVYLLDWGVPGATEASWGLEDYALRLIRPALGAVLRTSGATSAHLLGYCLGGTFALIAATRLHAIASVMALTTPVSLEEPGALGALCDERLLDLQRLAAAFPIVPGEMLWTSFQALDPVGIARKWKGFSERAEDAEFVERFEAQEGWLADPVAVTARALRDVVQGMYREDGLAKGTLVVEGRPVRLDEGKCPALVLVARGDGIVPPESSRGLVGRWGGPVTVRDFGGGHIGITVGSKAKTGMWAAVREWMNAEGAA